MKHMNEVVGDNNPKLPPHLQKLVTEGTLTHGQAIRVLQEQGHEPKLLLEG
jgi:hypothetical protein